jgi:hypothetical protein
VSCREAYEIYLTLAKAARELGESELELRRLCEQGRVPGARSIGWEIPASAIEKLRRAR